MSLKQKKISIITPVKNEQDNVEDLVTQIKKILESEESYLFEHILIDNCSTDDTRKNLEKVIRKNSHVGAIFNRRDFGVDRSTFYMLKNIEADAAIIITCDFQEPLELIPSFIRRWEKGNLIVGGIKKKNHGLE